MYNLHQITIIIFIILRLLVTFILEFYQIIKVLYCLNYINCAIFAANFLFNYFMTKYNIINYLFSFFTGSNFIHEEDEMENMDSVVDAAVIKSKDGTLWKEGSNTTIRKTFQCNILREMGGPTSYAKRNISEHDVSSIFSLLIDNFIVHHIKTCTEVEARNKSGNQLWTVSTNELHKVFAIMYARGVLAKNYDINSLWSNNYGMNIFKDTMPRDRYKEIIRYLRFDLRSTRSERLKTDKFALISVVWNKFVENCQALFKPYENITVDEQLFPTKARYPFTQYMANKPDKFGIKFWIAVDNNTKYFLNGFPYLGKDDHRPSNVSLSEHVVLKLVEPFTGKGRNITTDNFFTSLNLAKTLLQKKTTLVGTVNRIRKEVPDSLKSTKSPLYSTKVLTSNNITLTSYQGKKNKNVIILSSLHTNVTVSQEGKRLPETIDTYNATKFGVDILDQKARFYSTKVPCRRWPIQVFYNILDFAAINASVLYNQVLNKKLSRKKFILRLVDSLSGKELQEDDNGEENINETPLIGNKRKLSRSKCQVECKKNKTFDVCNKCLKYCCGKCTATVTITCKKCS